MGWPGLACRVDGQLQFIRAFTSRWERDVQYKQITVACCDAEADARNLLGEGHGQAAADYGSVHSADVFLGLRRRVSPKMEDDSSTCMDLNSTIRSADQYSDNTRSVATPSSCAIPPFSILQSLHFPFSIHPHPSSTPHFPKRYTG